MIEYHEVNVYVRRSFLPNVALMCYHGMPPSGLSIFLSYESSLVTHRSRFSTKVFSDIATIVEAAATSSVAGYTNQVMFELLQSPFVLVVLSTSLRCHGSIIAITEAFS